MDDKKQHLDNVNAAETAGLKRRDEKSSAQDLVNLFNPFVMFPIEITLGQSNCQMGTTWWYAPTSTRTKSACFARIYFSNSTVQKLLTHSPLWDGGIWRCQGGNVPHHETQSRSRP